MSLFKMLLIGITEMPGIFKSLEVGRLWQCRYGLSRQWILVLILLAGIFSLLLDRIYYRLALNPLTSCIIPKC